MFSGKPTTKSGVSYSPSDFFKQPRKQIDIDFAILSPMPEELEFFKNTFLQCPSENIRLYDFEFTVYEYHKKRVLLSHTGLGTTFAASVATMIYHHFHPNYFLLLGTAGGINPLLNIRDVIIVEKAFEAEIQDAFKLLKGTPFESCLTHPLNNKLFPSVYSADEELLSIASSLDFPTITVHTGSVVSSNAFPAPPELFEKIKKQSPYAIDMETSAIYQVAWFLKVPVLAVRGISNILNHDGSDDKIHESDIKGSTEAAATVLLKILDTLLLKNNPQEIHEKKLHSEAAKIIDSLKLERHPEGGYYTQIFKSNQLIKSSNSNQYNNKYRSAGSSIYYLLANNDFSAWHRLTSDEIWHYYKGSTVTIHTINQQGLLRSHLLGDFIQHPEAAFQITIPANTWFAAELTDKSSYCLVGCTVSPGFEFSDFELADRKSLSDQFPHHQSLITQLTRSSQYLSEDHNAAAVHPHKKIKSCL